MPSGVQGMTGYGAVVRSGVRLGRPGQGKRAAEAVPQGSSQSVSVTSPRPSSAVISGPLRSETRPRRV